MSAKPERDTAPLTEPLGDDADRLRSLVSAMLSGSYPEDVWLRDVTSQCQAKPEFGRKLLALIERYRRLGQIPAPQYSRVRQKIEASLPAQKIAARSDGPGAQAASGRPAARLPALPTEATLTAPLPIESAKARPASRPKRRAAPPAPAPAPAPPVPAPARTPAARAAPVPQAPAPQAPVPQAPPPHTAFVPAPAAPVSTAPASPAPLPSPRMPESSVPPGVPDGSSKTELIIEPGTVLRERYRLESLLGSGGMAVVYKALDRYRAKLGLPDCEVALKVATPYVATSAADAALGREFHNAQQLSHPNIVNVFDIDHENGATFYTMELLEGEQLDELLGRIGGPLPLAHALAIVRDIGAAIQHAHSRGILHADLKPQNVFVTHGGQVRVLDFGGLSMPAPGPWIDEPSLAPDSERYQTATPAYASCEQLEGQQVDPRDDIYALACISYELLTGRHPFDGQTALQARAQHLHARRAPQLTLSSWRALRRGLSFQRAQRPRDLGQWLEQVGVAAAAVRLPPSYELRAAAARSHWGRWVALAASLILGVGAALTLMRQYPSDSDWSAVLSSALGSLQQARDSVRERLGQLAAPKAGPDATSGAPGASGAPPAAAMGSQPVPVPENANSSRLADSGHPYRGPPDRLAGATAPGSSPQGTTTAAGGASGSASAAVAPTVPVSASATSAHPAADATPMRTQGVEFSSTTYKVNDSSPAARVVVRRNGSDQNKLRFVWWTVDDTAKADVDYAPLGRRTEYLLPGQDHMTLYVPIISNPLRHRTTTFYVALARPGATEDSPSARASVTIDRGG